MTCIFPLHMNAVIFILFVVMFWKIVYVAAYVLHTRLGPCQEIHVLNSFCLLQFVCFTFHPHCVFLWILSSSCGHINVDNDGVW